MRTHVWGGFVGDDARGGGVGGLVATVIHNGPNAGVYFAVYDGNGNVMGYVRASDGGVVAQYEYGPFGELLRATGPWRRPSIISSPPNTLTGKPASLTTATATTPHPGRWLSRDPIGEVGGLNRYGFGSNDPNNNVDPFGLQILRKHPHEYDAID
ncbi:hypothetical protein NXS98_07640 [Fontisphaera persica]|uniref:RHS repeat-associated core domain-containing protein n=1 Tax=Fontisphaera persica TaxID=2974023 RepID=UPI0024C01330|nr:RHS repeat-associated core domain-containing protein [Fontisphaera persica]WCJ60981.1 hypothetical protein NXS98_07640 [Fontisphaera persica]